jgi:hypothetical protein
VRRMRYLIEGGDVRIEEKKDDRGEEKVIIIK